MKYELKISNATEENGTIDLLRLANIAESIRKIAEGALQIRLKGVSITRGRKKDSLKKSLKISLSGIKAGSTILQLESEKFEKTLGHIQLDLFRSESQLELKEQTPISLFVSSFKAVFDNQGQSDLLDKALLNKLKYFKKSFLNENEVFTISNEGSFDTLKLDNKSFDQIEDLEENIPPSEPVILNGIVEELQYSKLRVKIITNDGPVSGFLSEELQAEEISSFWGREITITGINHYKSNNTSVIEIKRIHTPGSDDSYFSKKSKKPLSVEEQITSQIEEKSGNKLRDVTGKWPGEESFDDLLKML